MVTARKIITNASSYTTGGDTWSIWNDGYSYLRTEGYGFTTNSATTSSNTWVLWNRQYDTSSNALTTVTANWIDTSTYDNPNDQVWTSWNVNWRPAAAQVIGLHRGAPAVHTETEEQRTARLAQEATWAAERLLGDQVKKSARERAEKLLLSLLNEDQKRDWVASGAFYLHVGENKYRIKKGRAGNVELVDQRNNEALERYCAHPVDQVPDEDTVVAQMMMLQFSEKEFIALANRPFRKEGFKRKDGLEKVNGFIPTQERRMAA